MDVKRAKDDKKKKGTGAVTLQTIADALGVSRTTVSNAFNRPDQMTPELRDKILAKATELDYCGPDPAARMLRKGKSGTIAVHFTESLAYAVSDPAAIQFLQGIAAATEEAGIRLLLLPGPEDRLAAVAGVREAVADGFIVWSLPIEDPLLQTILGRSEPVVLVEGDQVGRAASVRLDDRPAARAIAQHLVDLGHRSFGVIVYPTREDNFEGFADAERRASAQYATSRDRLAGYADALTAAGIDWASVPVFETRLNHPQNGARAARALLERSPRPTAILATSDLLALAAMDVAKERGIAVPADLSIAGFDDIAAAAESDPPLTTARNPLAEKGKIAAKLLLDGWEGEPPSIWIPADLVIRGSTGPNTT